MIQKTENKKHNKSTIFILPMLGNKWKYWQDSGLYNCYVGDFDKPEYPDNIFTLFDFQGTVGFTNFEESLKSRSDYKDSYDIKGKGYVMYVFNVPEQYKEDFNRYSTSRYSTFSGNYKDTILNFFDIDKVKARYEVTNKPEKPSLAQILFPKQSDREFYIKQRLGCDYENWWEIYEAIDSQELFDQRNLHVYNDKKVEPLNNDR